MTSVQAFWCITQRQMSLLTRKGGIVGMSAFLLALFGPFAMVSNVSGPSISILLLVWLGLSLATFVAVEDSWQSDKQDGTLDTLVQLRLSMPYACAKVLACWVCLGLPLAVLGAMFFCAIAGTSQIWHVLALNSIGGLVVTSLTSLCSLCTIKARGHAYLLMPLLVLPLLTPIFVLGLVSVYDYGSVSATLGLALVISTTLLPLLAAGKLLDVSA